MAERNRSGTWAATSLVVASMIGTGVFTSLGFQLVNLDSGPVILLLWTLGGLVALCGALCYAELASTLPKSGGEYHYLGKIYHPAFGFMAGMLSAIAGFAAPTALSALAFGEYLHKAAPQIAVKPAAIGVVLAASFAHFWSARTSARVQVVSTALKFLLIFGFIGAAFFLPGRGDIRWEFEASRDLPQIWQPAFAVALLFVFYSYSGWNAAVYGLEEWDRPEKTVHRALVGGTLLVIALYVALNSVFLYAAPIGEMRGVVEVGHVAARSLVGDAAARSISGLFAMGLFASVSALLWAGPRVLDAMGRDLSSLRFFVRTKEAPRRALVFQGGLAVALILLGDFAPLLTYTQIGLTLCTSLAVSGIFLLRRRHPGVRPAAPMPLYPIPALIFLAMTGFVIVRSLIASPVPSLAGLLTAAACALLWFPIKHCSR